MPRLILGSNQKRFIIVIDEVASEEYIVLGLRQMMDVNVAHINDVLLNVASERIHQLEFGLYVAYIMYQKVQKVKSDARLILRFLLLVLSSILTLTLMFQQK